MNNRKRKIEQAKRKINTKKRKQLHKLFDLVIDINGLEPRKQEKTGNLPTAFFDFSGHVFHARIAVHTNGWLSGENADFCDDWGTGSLQDKIKNLENLKRDLQKRNSHGLT